MTLREHVVHGLGASVAATLVPDSWITLGERVLIAFLLAAVSTAASVLTKTLFRKAGIK